MSNNAIKRMDITQVKYTPMDGEVVQHTLDDCYYIWKDDTWNKFQIEGGGLELGLYDLNKQIIEQLPTLTPEELENKEETINELHKKYNNEFYMLYGKEISYFTLFKLNKNTTQFGNEVIDCLKNVGFIKSIDKTETEDAIEIWVQPETIESTCLYLFPYDSGLVEVR